MSESIKSAPTHTLGPWTATRGQCDDEPQDWYDVDGAPEPYADVPGAIFPQSVCVVYGHEGAAEANARLIAAAPDLLTAARTVLTALEKVDIAADSLTWIQERELLFAAIAKAEGR